MVNPCSEAMLFVCFIGYSYKTLISASTSRAVYNLNEELNRLNQLHRLHRWELYTEKHDSILEVVFEVERNFGAKSKHWLDVSWCWWFDLVSTSSFNHLVFICLLVPAGMNFSYVYLYGYCFAPSRTFLFPYNNITYAYNKHPTPINNQLTE